MQRILSRLKKYDGTLLFACILFVIIYLLMHDLGRVSILDHNMWDSYTLQAMSWREGRFDLGQNYDWLELAIFEGKYYVSFPPVPTLPMFILTFFFEADTPSNLVVLAYALLSFIVLYKLFIKRDFSQNASLFWAAFLTLGSNLASIVIYGGVWFQAQSLCFLLISLSLYASLVQKQAWLAYAYLALAVGCRPFVICFFPVLMLHFYEREKERLDRPFSPLRFLLPLLIPAFIGGVYMWYNFARFNDVLEFGHNYLPEFIEAEMGQFHPSYISQNFYNIFLRGVWIDQFGFLSYSTFDGFLLWIANPFYIVFAAILLSRYVNRQWSFMDTALLACVALHLLALMLHKTFGGWQFGARYTTDGLPFLALPLLLAKPQKVSPWMLFLGLFAIAFNLYGAVSMLTINTH